ncbi:hypothetical protein [Caballeronia sordidicola]|uniref:Uncharacterized protein n=1 Tax=Caballeronia sordidicola TaxID=196367 RepID=A0A242M426_CABSO|nr:hypothetical protein [Caballeronia sordidicola]OTP65941.1 hypothetical protein PAMC26577_38660 [Caballeronia sordidicola]
MAEQPEQDRVWDFATEAYLPSDDEKLANGKTLISDEADVGITTSLNTLLNAEPDRPDEDPDVDSEPAQ